MKLYFSFLLLFTTSLLFSQKNVVIKGDWSIVISEESTFKISKRSIEVNDAKNDIYKAYYQYKFENLTESKLFLNWNFITQYKNFSSGDLPTQENYRTLLLEPEQVFIPDYLTTKDKPFFVFKQFLNKLPNVTLETVRFYELKFKKL